MSTVSEIALELNNVNKEIAGLAKVALNKTALDLLAAFIATSPVGETGDFRRGWDFKPETSLKAGVVAQVTIFNSVQYAPPIEYGSPTGGRPWPSAGPKTVEQDGRIYSKMAVGGVITPIFDDEEFVDNLAEEMSSFIFGGLA